MEYFDGNGVNLMISVNFIKIIYFFVISENECCYERYFIFGMKKKVMLLIKTIILIYEHFYRNLKLNYAKIANVISKIVLTITVN